MAEAELAQSRRRAEQTVVLAEAESRGQILAGKGEGHRILQAGLAEAAVLMRKIASYGDPRLFALERSVRQLSKSTQPLVPERVFLTGNGAANGDSHPQALLGTAGLLLQLMLAERTTQQSEPDEASDSLKTYMEQWMSQSLDTMAKARDETAANLPPAGDEKR